MMLPSGYLDSRQQFFECAARLDVAPHSYFYETGDAGLPRLSTDTVYLGPTDARTLVVIVSGTHGVEGYAGAACQFRFMRTYRARYANRGAAFLLVHALNAWGYFHDRRVTQEGVDLNRNFVDFPLPQEARCDYDAYHRLLVANYRPLPHGLWNEIRLLSHGLTAGRRRKLQAAITAGQHRHPDGLFFGGAGPTQSRLIWEDIVRTQVAGRARAFLLDLHTGLGARGAGELISDLPSSSDKFRQMADWFRGKLKSMADGESVSAALTGTMTAAFARAAGGEHYAAGLEFGTRAPLAVLNALRADHWYHNNATRLSQAERERVRRKMKAAFAPADHAWCDRVAARFDQVTEQLVRGLAGG